MLSLLWGCVVSGPAIRAEEYPPAPEELEYPLDAYVREAYMKPLWGGGIVYQESVMPLEEPDGSMKDIQLLYEASEIISVRSSDLLTEYTQGVDYDLVNGKLRILDGAIPHVLWATLYPPQEIVPAPPYSLMLPGKTVPWLWIEGGSLFHTWQLAVTYRHEDAWPGQIPPRQGSRLPNTLAKLEAGEPLRMVVFGDSLNVGAQSSGWCDAEPYAPAFFDMFANTLEARYGSEITVVNTAVGGTDSAWGVKNAKELAAGHAPDLMLISFGGNDAPARVRPAAYALNMLRLVARIKAQNPECEFILLATALPNPLSNFATGYHERYRPWLLRLAQESVAMMDMTTIHQDLLARKRFEDFNANNVNHPNDFFARVYAQALMETVQL